MAVKELKLAKYDIYPQYNKRGERYDRHDKNRPCFKSTSLNSSTNDTTVVAVDDTQIHDELTVIRSWYSSTGFCLVGYETFSVRRGDKYIDGKRYQEWWCTPSQE